MSNVFSFVCLMTQFCSEVMISLNEQVITGVKMLNLSCYSLLLPVWQELATKSLPDRKLVMLILCVCNNLLQPVSTQPSVML